MVTAREHAGPDGDIGTFRDQFVASRVLKKGMGVETFAGVDRDRGVEVIIKTVAAGGLPNGAWLRLEHEGRVLHALDSPHLTPLVHLGHHDGVVYLVRDLVPGVTLRDRLERGRIPLGKALVLARCLLDALCVAHQLGVLHLDVKPANIIVSAGDDHASVRDMTAGTVQYMSPEQAGLTSHAVDERSALGQLGAGIAHELNQPLQAIRGFAQRLQRRADKPHEERTDELGIILDATTRMARIIDNVRVFSRDEPLHLAPTDVLCAIADALMLVGRQLEHRGIEVRWASRPSHALWVQGDRAKLQQVFLNLLINARDAVESVPEGRPRWIELRAESTLERVEVVVADSGPGVSARDEGRLFEPFFTTKDAGAGTGLGLAIAHGIVREHGGELLYRRPASVGAAFVVRLGRAKRG